jgi:diguanylate cyclase (GGDEF)-like protein
MAEAPKTMSGGLSAAAAAFEFAVVWATGFAVAAYGLPTDVSTDDWIAFAVLVPLIAATHLLAREREKYQGSHLSLAPMFAAALVLPPALAAAAIAIAFVPEWIRTRVAWYIVVFNAANFVGPALASRAVFDAVETGGRGSWTLAALAGIGTFLVLQYAVLATMLRLARGVPVRDTVRIDCVLIDAGLLSLGALAAALAEEHWSLVLLLLLPLALDYRALAIPSLVEASRIEPKTGLFNVRHLTAALEQELRRAERFGRPLSLLMIDVDHLRRINNSLGHVAGDQALRLVAMSLRSLTRDYDVAARFGGDEFCVLLPETDAAGALRVADRIREDVERSGKGAGIQLTVSVGVASATRPGLTADELVTLADSAAYRAKSGGRNAVAMPPEGPVEAAERALAEAAEAE